MAYTRQQPTKPSNVQQWHEFNGTWSEYLEYLNQNGKLSPNLQHVVKPKSQCVDRVADTLFD